MNTTENHYRLGIEELAVALSLAGSPESAKGLLVANFGELDENEERGRLLAAHHSLMARGLLTLKGQDPQLEEKFKRTVSFIIKNDYFLQFNKGAGEIEDIRSYYYRKDKIIDHQIESGVIHALSQVGQREEIISSGIDYFGLQKLDSFDCPEVDIPQAQLEDVKTVAGTKPEETPAFLGSLGFDSSTSELLAEDFIDPQQRGSVMRVENQGGELRSDRGFLVMIGKRRGWLFRIFINKDETFVRILPGVPEVFSKELKAII
jgi:hypothetical protein